MSERLVQLKQLGELLSAGVLTQAEFEQQKIRILNGELDGRRQSATGSCEAVILAWSGRGHR
ncbi:MAG TPA: SHOCT domain-containing protein [Streptosporangiaceae bacterium]